MSRGLSGWVLGVLCVMQPGLGAAAVAEDTHETAEGREERRRLETEFPELLSSSLPSDAFVTIPAVDFFHQFPGNDFVNANLSRGCNGDVHCPFYAGVPVPHGALIVGIEVEGCANAGGTGSMALYLYRVSAGANEPQLLGQGVVPNGFGCAFFTAPLTTPHVADQYLASYVARLSLTFAGPKYSFTSVRVYYRPGEGAVVPEGTVPTLFP